MMQQITALFQLEEALLAAQARADAVTEERKLAKYNLRESKDRSLQYGGSIRSLLDRLAGRREEREEQLNREIRHGEDALAALTRERDALAEKLEQLRSDLERLPSRDALRSRAMEDPETGKAFAALEVRHLARQLQPLLEGAENALLEYRKTMQGSRTGEIMTYEKLHEYGTAPNVWGQKCCPLLKRLQEDLEILGQPFTVEVWFENPAGYVVSAAAKHNRFDRLNEALSQVAATRRAVSRILNTQE